MRRIILYFILCLMLTACSKQEAKEPTVAETSMPEATIATETETEEEKETVKETALETVKPIEVKDLTKETETEEEEAEKEEQKEPETVMVNLTPEGYTEASVTGKKEKKIIVIDPGHQAKANSDKEPVGPGSSNVKPKVSSGTEGTVTGVKEYELNLTLSMKLKAELENRGYQVIMIRTTNDVDISNVERAEIANEARADAFLRIHADYSENSKTHGCMTICQTQNNPYNADIFPECYALSEAVLGEMLQTTGANNRGVYQSDTYSGINWCTVPVTIVEVGLMSNPEEDRKLQTEDYQNKIVIGIANGVDKFVGTE